MPIHIYSTVARVLLVATLSMSVSMSASLLRAQDRLYPLQGAATTGSIQELTRDKVVMQVRGNNQNFPSNAIGWIVFEGEPANMGRAKEFVSKGQYDEAMVELRKIDSTALKSDNSKNDLQFYLAFVEGKLAMSGKGDAGKSVKSLLAYVGANKDSHHFYECSELLGELAVQLGSYDNAARYFGALSKAPFKELTTRSRYLEGKALFAQGKFPEAKKACADAMSGGASDANALKIQKLASVLSARCEIGEGNTDAGLATLTKMIQENDSSDGELFSKIYNAQGEAHWKANRPEEAAIAYLHTDLLFANQPDSHAEALYYLFQIWNKLGDPARAAEAKEKLTTSYAGTAWAKK